VASGDVDGTGQRALVVLVGLADIEDDRAWDLAPFVGLRRADLGDPSLGLGEELAEAGHG
jgi:hypothetical protein